MANMMVRYCLLKMLVNHIITSIVCCGHLSVQKKLDKLAGLIVGGFTSLKDSDPAFGQRFEDIIMDKVRAYDFPVAFGYPAGHIDNNHSLIMGKNIKLRVKKRRNFVKIP